MATIRFTDGGTTESVDGNSRGDLKLKPPAGETGTQQFDLIRSSGANARTSAKALNRMFAQARIRNGLNGLPADPSRARIFAELDIDGNGYWRTEVIDGEADGSAEPISIYSQSGYARVPLSFQHKKGWEGPLTSLSIANTNTPAGTSSGLVINGHTATGAASYFTVAGSQIDGDDLCRCKLEITNTLGGTQVTEMLVGMLHGSTAWMSAAALQGESAAYAVNSGGGGNNSNVNASGGVFKRCVWNGTSQFVIGWTVGDSLLGLTRGRPIVPVVRLFNTVAYTDLQVRFALFYDNIVPLARTDWQTVSNSQQIIIGQPLPFPPRPVPGSFANHTLYMEGRRVGGSTTVDVDFCHLFPTDGLRYYKAASYYLGSGDKLVDDGTEDLLYTDSGGSQSPNFITELQRPFELIPGQAATFCILAGQNSIGITQTYTAKLSVRPKRRGI